MGKGANGERGRSAGAADSGAAIDGEGHPSGGGRGAVRSAPLHASLSPAHQGQRWVTGGARGRQGRDTWGRARGECRLPRWRETAGGWPRPAAPGAGAGGGCGDGWN